MRRALLFCLILLLPIVSATIDERVTWQKDLENGYISTKPLIIEEQVIVRTSGLGTGSENPHVYAFNLLTGEENWIYRSPNSSQYELSPLLFVESGEGECGSWPSMIIVGWNDGRVTALEAMTGAEIWATQTEVISWGITGSMALDSDLVVVPTRKGLSSFCLSDGTLNLRVELSELGWRNGVTVSNEAYFLGNEEGVLNKVYKNGTIEKESLGEGMIRHAPILTQHGIFLHLQTTEGSKLILDGEIIASSGRSPAIPIQHKNIIHASTLSEYLVIDCTENNCTIVDRFDFKSNGEIVVNQFADGEYEVWLPSNSPEGGWGIFSETSSMKMYTTEYDTFTTAGPGFGKFQSLALGSDSGVLQVSFIQQNTSTEFDYWGAFSLLLVAISVGFISLGFAFNKSNTKAIMVLILIISIHALPDIANKWSGTVVEQIEPNHSDWNESWSQEWKGTQVVVFSTPSGEVAIGGLSGYDTVESLTDAAANNAGIIIEKEEHDLGTWIRSINGESGDGWEFTIDGTKSLVGISYAAVQEDSVVRWLPA